VSDDRPTIEELTVLTGRCCIDIYHDFTEEEVKKMPMSIQNAWSVARDLIAASFKRDT